MTPQWLDNLDAEKTTETPYESTGYRYSVILQPEQLLPAVRALWDEGYFLEDVMGTDVKEGFEVLYHFDRWEKADRVCLRLLVAPEEPVAPSISSIYKGALWHERETFDFYGIQFEGHPGLRPLLLPDDMEEHPLIKEKGKKPLAKVVPFAKRAAKPKPKPEKSADDKAQNDAAEAK